MPSPDAAHRAFPPPTSPWALQMTWLDLCFLHWPVDAVALAGLLPPGLTLDSYAGRAYLGVVPFRMADVRPRLAPAVPGLSFFPELNLRTYVTVGGVPGVWFFSLDAANPLAVRLARAAFHLPYFDARMSARREGQSVLYRSQRTHRGAYPARFEGHYAPAGPVFGAQPGSLEDWLTARYALYSSAGGRVYRGHIHHAPWPLQRASHATQHNTLADQIGVHLQGQPHALFARRLDVHAWLIERVEPDPPA